MTIPVLGPYPIRTWDCDGILARTITTLVPYPIRIRGCDWLAMDGLAWAPLAMSGQALGGRTWNVKKDLECKE